jgi:cell division protein FtsI (penicillin-binding protein 3)
VKKYDTRLKRRIYGLLVLFSFFGLVLMAGAFQHQVVRRDHYRSWADKQRFQPVRLTPLRGKILDRRGTPMAVSLKAGSVFAHPASVKDPDAVAQRLSPPLGVKPDRLADRLRQKRTFAWLARQIPLDTAREIRDMKLPGVGMETEGKRYYPNRELAGHVLGFTGVDSQGLEGLEWGFDQYLKGQQGRLLFQRDARGRVLWQEVPEKQGSGGCCELELTLDLRIQFFAEEALAEAVRSSGALSGTAVVMDPRSGEILAMACAPEFDPNAYRRSSPTRWRNRAITDSFEPGSTIKVFSLAAALEEGVVQEDTKIYCEEGNFRYGGCLLHDMKPHGELSVREVLMVSSNIGTTKIADKLGGPRLWSYLDAFGFGKKTGVDLPGEVSGALRDEGTWSQVAVATHSYGQGFSVSPLQLARAFSALANGGLLMEPYLVKTVRDEQGRVLRERQPRVVRRVLSTRTARRALDLMEAVVAEGTGKEARIRGYRVGGKTGTAQKFDVEARAYSDDRSVVSFVGILPLENPEMVVVVVLDEPQGKASGGKTAAPVFRRIASRSLYYRKVPARVPVSTEASFSVERISLARERPSEPVRFCPVAASALHGAGTREMPDVRFRPLRSALRMLDGLPVTVRLEGSGTVMAQDPPPGSRLGAGTTLFLRAYPGSR